MSIALEASRFPYIGDGAQLSFPYPTKFFEDADLVVTVDGATQTLNTHYTVTGAGAINGGSVNFLTAPADDAEIVIWLEPPFVQELDYVPNDAFPAESHENALDKLTQQTRYLLEQVSRALRVPMTEAQISAFTVAARAGKLLGFDSVGAIQFYVPAEAGAASGLGYVLFEDATARDAATPAFIGQIGVQVDTFALYVGDGLTAGDWMSASGAAGPIELNDIQQSGAAVGQVPKWDGTLWVAANDETGASLAGSAAVATNFAQLQIAVAAANAGTGPKTIIANGEFLFTEHLAEINSTGSDLSIRDDVVLQPSLGTIFDTRRNVFGPYAETVVTGNLAADLVWNIAAHPFGNGACLRVLSNGPLPMLATGVRMSRNTAYYVVQATADTFKLALNRGGTALVSGQTVKNIVDMWFYCALDSADVDNAAGFLSFGIAAHGVLENARVWFQTSPAGGTLPGGITSGTTGRYYAINVTADSFEVTTVVGAQGSRVVFAGAGTGEGHLFVQTFLFQIDGGFEGHNQRHFRNFMTGYEVQATTYRGNPSVFGMMGGADRKMVWWTDQPQAGFENLIMNCLGLYTSGGTAMGSYLKDKRIRDSTEGFRAALASHARIRGKTGTGTSANDVNTMYLSIFANSRVLFPSGMLRLTDYISLNDGRSMRSFGQGMNNTVIFADLWKENPNLHELGHSTAGPKYALFLLFDAVPGIYIDGFSVAATSRCPGMSALLYLANGGTLENGRFANLRFMTYKRWAICMGPQVVNHCKFIDIYTQGCQHPLSTAVGGISGSGHHKFTFEGATLNSSRYSPYYAYRGFELNNGVECRITRIHMEQTFGAFEVNAPRVSIPCIDQVDDIAVEAVFHLFEPIGSNEYLLWPLWRESKRQLTAPVMGAGTMQFTTSSAHSLAVGDHVALMGHGADFTGDETGGTVEDMILLTAHGFTDEDPVVFYNTGAGLPGGITEGVIYYAIVTDPNYFQIEATLGGGAVAFTSDGVGKVGSPLTGVYRCTTGTTGSTLVVAVPAVSQAGLQTVPGSLAATTELRSMRVRHYLNSVGNRDPIVFDPGVLGTLRAPVGLVNEQFYWTHGYQIVELNAVDSFVAGSPIVTAVAHGFVNNDVVFISPSIGQEDTPSNWMMPAGLDSVRPYWVERLSDDTFHLHTAPGLPFGAPVFGTPVTITEESNVDGNGTLGDESVYYACRVKYQLATNVTNADAGTALAFTGTIPTLVERAPFLSQIKNGSHLAEIRNCTYERTATLITGPGETRSRLKLFSVMPILKTDSTPKIIPPEPLPEAFTNVRGTVETDGTRYDHFFARS